MHWFHTILHVALPERKMLDRTKFETKRFIISVHQIQDD
jgi:hypothetical protein